MYRSSLNAGMPLLLIKNEYRKHLAVSFIHNNEPYVENQAVENLLQNTALMKSIANEMQQEQATQNTAVEDEEINTRRFSRPSKERDYE